jgi:hypothetical protein
MLAGFHTNAFTEHDLATVGALLRQFGCGAVAVSLSLARLDPMAEESVRTMQVGLLATGARQMQIVLDADGPFLIDPWNPDPPGLIDRGDSDSARVEVTRREEYLRSTIDLAGEIGGKLVSFSVGRQPAGDDIQSAMDRLSAIIDRLSARARQAGVKIAIRPRFGHLVDSVGRFERLMEWLGNDGTVVCAADVGVMVAGGEMPVVDLLGRLGDRLGCVYLSDVRPCEQRTADALIGQGQVSAARVVSGLASRDYAGPIILEPSGQIRLLPATGRNMFRQVFGIANVGDGGSQTPVSG